MARLLAWIPLVTGAFATWNDAALPISVPKVSNIGGDQAISAVVGNSYSKDASVSVGVIIIATSEGGSSSVKTWNEPMMAAGTVHQVGADGRYCLLLISFFLWPLADTYCCRSPSAVKLASFTHLKLSTLPLAT